MLVLDKYFVEIWSLFSSICADYRFLFDHPGEGGPVEATLIHDLDAVRPCVGLLLLLLRVILGLRPWPRLRRHPRGCPSAPTAGFGANIRGWATA